MQIPDTLMYTKEHEWVKISGMEATFGITEYAQSALGDITFIELPKVGAKVSQFQCYANVESVKAASDVFAPLSGTVVKANSDVPSSPELVNKSPYEKGWFVVITIDNEKEKANLMTAGAYQKYLEGLH